MKTFTLLTSLSLALLLPTAPAEGYEGPGEEDTVYTECADRSCALILSVNITVEGCDETTCVLSINASAVANARLPGLLYLGNFVAIDNSGETSGSLCVGPKAVNDLAESSVPCGKVCENMTVGTIISCRNVTVREVSLPQKGDCAAIWVSSTFAWNQLYYAHGTLLFGFCHRANGTLDLFAYPFN